MSARAKQCQSCRGFIRCCVSSMTLAELEEHLTDKGHYDEYQKAVLAFEREIDRSSGYVKNVKLKLPSFVQVSQTEASCLTLNMGVFWPKDVYERIKKKTLEKPTTLKFQGRAIWHDQRQQARFRPALAPRLQSTAGSVRTVACSKLQKPAAAATDDSGAGPQEGTAKIAGWCRGSATAGSLPRGRGLSPREARSGGGRRLASSSADGSARGAASAVGRTWGRKVVQIVRRQGHFCRRHLCRRAVVLGETPKGGQTARVRLPLLPARLREQLQARVSGGTDRFTTACGRDQRLHDEFREWRCRMIENIKQSGRGFRRGGRGSFSVPSVAGLRTSS